MDGILFDQYLDDWFALTLVEDWVDPPLAFAVMLSESGVRAPDGIQRPNMLQVSPVDNPTSPAHRSNDLGIWQLNSYWHPVGDVTAFSPFLSTNYTERVSNQGRNFGQWIGFTSGGYIRHLPRARAAWAKLQGQ